MSPCPAASAEPALREAPRPAQVGVLGRGSSNRGLTAWPLERVLAAMAPGEALDAGDLLARLQFTGAAVPALCTLQHRLHGGWIEGVLERSAPAGRATAASPASRWSASLRVRPGTECHGCA